jgi:hypothetical protein
MRVQPAPGSAGYLVGPGSVTKTVTVSIQKAALQRKLPVASAVWLQEVAGPVWGVHVAGALQQPDVLLRHSTRAALLHTQEEKRDEIMIISTAVLMFRAPPHPGQKAAREQIAV